MEYSGNAMCRFPFPVVPPRQKVTVLPAPDGAASMWRETPHETDRSDTCEFAAGRPSPGERAAYRVHLIAMQALANMVSTTIVLAMTKLIALFMAALALIQFIKPLGLPGLTRRQDAWKLAIAGAGLMLVFILVTAGFK